VILPCSFTIKIVASSALWRCPLLWRTALQCYSTAPCSPSPKTRSLRFIPSSQFRT